MSILLDDGGMLYKKRIYDDDGSYEYHWVYFDSIMAMVTCYIMPEVSDALQMESKLFNSLTKLKG